MSQATLAQPETRVTAPCRRGAVAPEILQDVLSCSVRADVVLPPLSWAHRTLRCGWVLL